ncbi:NUDIX hydrolase [Paludibacterium yongneupense]|uniref:NUDIX hydrolase n=1 Tax=Paludibacterium yongneupense TaxID=400061 RepID=UPI00041C3821|nr:NUDIX hydrolase [Paludibacterium yongneupense]
MTVNPKGPETRWKPNVTVAACIEREGRFLLVHEHTQQGLRYNQPAGHLEPGETLLEAVCREVREETAWQVEPQALLGIYLTHGAATQYLRFCFVCRPLEDLGTPLDDGIVAADWFSYEQILALRPLHRTPALLAGIEDFRRGQRHPLELLHDLAAT